MRCGAHGECPLESGFFTFRRTARVADLSCGGITTRRKSWHRLPGSPATFHAAVLPNNVWPFERPGHTPGNQSVALDTSEGLLILACQAAYMLEEWANTSVELEVGLVRAKNAPLRCGTALNRNRNRITRSAQGQQTRSPLRRRGRLFEYGLGGSQLRSGEQGSSHLQAESYFCDSHADAHASGRSLLRTIQRQRVATHRGRAARARLSQMVCGGWARASSIVHEKCDFRSSGRLLAPSPWRRGVGASFPVDLRGSC